MLGTIFNRFGNATDSAFDQQGRVEMLWRDLNQTNFRISDLSLNTDRVFEMQNEIEDIQEHIRNIKYHLLEDNTKIKEISNIIEQQITFLPYNKTPSNMPWSVNAYFYALHTLQKLIRPLVTLLKDLSKERIWNYKILPKYLESFFKLLFSYLFLLVRMEVFEFKRIAFSGS